MTNSAWPELSLADWEPTYKTLHRWMQIVGKVTLDLCAPEPHWWHTALRFRSRGLGTLLMPFGSDQLEILFDFADHQLQLETSSGKREVIALEPRSVAQMYAAMVASLDRLGYRLPIWPMPVEIPNPVRFDEDHDNASYDREAVSRMWKILSSAQASLRRASGDFVGKRSPVHFFWGAFDLAVTRFSGRANPSPPPDRVMGEAYSHEVISHGFWFGGDWPMGGRVEEPIFYAYAVPEPAGFSEAAVEPADAAYSSSFHEFILPYGAVRASADPDAAIHAFVRSTYEAGARLGGWPPGLTR